MLTANILSVVGRFTHGLFAWLGPRPQSAARQTDLSAMAAPIPARVQPFIPSGGATSVSTNAATYWASLPRLELPETNLTPHYLEDFILHPPMEAA